MHRSTIAIVVAVIVIIAIVMPLILGEYYLTTPRQQRVIQQIRATVVTSR